MSSGTPFGTESLFCCSRTRSRILKGGGNCELKRCASFEDIALVREFVSGFDCKWHHVHVPSSMFWQARAKAFRMQSLGMLPHTFVQSKPSTHAPDDDDEISSDCASCMMEREVCACGAPLFLQRWCRPAVLRVRSSWGRISSSAFTTAARACSPPSHLASGLPLEVR